MPTFFCSLKLLKSLNPCFTGRWYRSLINAQVSEHYAVLILVLLEDGIGAVGQVLEITRGT